ncbi:MAG TPA: ABC transporter substrate-binding protein [Planosporangium sp.]|jgi:ABC-type branched-subunit amino acid transport system substrate-binding protein|nr:ABC transporter substrate-binding protein [Planosporangium sp.]
MRRVARQISTFTAVTAVLLAASCATSKGSGPGAAAGDGQVRLYGSDGNMSSSFGDALKDQQGVLAGMKGTAPLSALTDEFKKRIRGVDPTLPDYNYGGEAYDAVIVTALAAETAHSTDASVVAKYVVGVTVGGTTCGSFQECVTLVRQNENIQYRGVSSLKRSGLTDAGEPSTATYGTLNFGRDNRIDDAKTEFVGAGDESTASKSQPAPPPAPTNSRAPKVPPLKFGGLLPRTGALASAGPPIFAGGKLAVQEVNEAGGVLGQPVEWLDGDDGTSAQTAVAAADKFMAAGVQVMIGPAASGASAAVLPKAVAAGRILFSPSATSEGLSQLDDKGLFFRTAPSDKLQAKALADVVMRDGAAKVVIVARDDDYGTGLRNGIQADLSGAGIKAGNIRVLSYKVKEKYDAGDQSSIWKPLAKNVKEFGADAVVIIGFEESANVIKALRDQQVSFKS